MLKHGEDVAFLQLRLNVRAPAIVAEIQGSWQDIYWTLPRVPNDSALPKPTSKSGDDKSMLRAGGSCQVHSNHALFRWRTIRCACVCFGRSSRCELLKAVKWHPTCRCVVRMGRAGCEKGEPTGQRQINGQFHHFHTSTSSQGRSTDSCRATRVQSRACIVK